MRVMRKVDCVNIPGNLYIIKFNIVFKARGRQDDKTNVLCYLLSCKMIYFMEFSSILHSKKYYPTGDIEGDISNGIFII